MIVQTTPYAKEQGHNWRAIAYQSQHWWDRHGRQHAIFYMDDEYRRAAAAFFVRHCAAQLYEDVREAPTAEPDQPYSANQPDEEYFEWHREAQLWAEQLPVVQALLHGPRVQSLRFPEPNSVRF